MDTSRTISTAGGDRRRAMLAVTFVAAGVAIVVTGWAVATRRSGFSASSLLLVVSGDTGGWITPCGCTVNQSGGLPRRATYLAGLRQRHAVIYADVGGVIDGDTAYHALKAQAIFRGEQRMQIAAQNLGATELALGPKVLHDLAQATGIPLVSANVTAADSTAPAPPARIVTEASVRVALIGVVAPKFAGAAWRVSEPREAILRTAATLHGQYDRLVVLAYLEAAELEALASTLPEADAVIGGPTGQSLKPQRVGGAGTLLSSATRKGKFMVEASFEAGVPARIVELNGTFADAPGQVANVAQFHEDLRRADFPATTTGLARAAPRQGKVAGTASCQECHQPEYAIWSAAGHSRAWKGLLNGGGQVDPSCQVCHTTNYAAPGGFLTMAASMDRVNVGCENCHGPSAAHVAEPKVRTPFLATAQCVTCHDEENSPAFDFKTYWARIRHEAPATAPTREAKP